MEISVAWRVDSHRDWGMLWMVLFRYYKVKDLSTLKEHLDSKPHGNQNQDKDVKLWTWSFVQPVGAK